MSFFDKVKKFNDMYKLPENGNFDHGQRLVNFKSIIEEEVTEVNEIIDKINNDNPDFKTDLADWLGDIVVYCASEARRWGIPLEQVLDIIMESNFSKLDPDGKPIYDERGKVMKGPGYWRPEAKIRELFSEKDNK